MTSWTKRITNIPIVMGTLLNQTIMPNEIVLNLLIDEFKNKEKDLPLQVTNFLEENKELIYINWLPGKNIRSWKKTLPTFNPIIMKHINVIRYVGAVVFVIERI